MEEEIPILPPQQLRFVSNANNSVHQVMNTIPVILVYLRARNCSSLNSCTAPKESNLPLRLSTLMFPVTAVVVIVVPHRRYHLLVVVHQLRRPG